MSKKHYIQAHEALVEEYMNAHPDADWTEAYEATSDHAYGRMIDNLADRADQMRQLRKDGLL